MFRRHIMMAMQSSGPDIVLKNYITTTIDGQYIALYPTIPARQQDTVMEIVYQTTNTSVLQYVASVSSNCYIAANKSYCAPYNISRLANYSISANTDISAGFNTANGYCYVNNNSGTCSTINTSTGSATRMALFRRGTASTSVAGVIKIKYVHITTNTDEYTLVPALYNGEAVLYDAVHGITVKADTGDLAVS